MSVSDRDVLPRIGLFPPGKLTLQCSQPLHESIFTGRTEPVALFFHDNLHAVGFAS